VPAYLWLCLPALWAGALVVAPPPDVGGVVFFAIPTALATFVLGWRFAAFTRNRMHHDANSPSTGSSSMAVLE